MPCSGNAMEQGSCTGLPQHQTLLEINQLIWTHLTVEGVWENWNAWGACSGVTKFRTRSHTNGTAPCSSSNSETGLCGCSNPSLSISYQQAFYTSGSYSAVKALDDNVPETSTVHFWMGVTNAEPQKFRIRLSCAKDISVINIRNSGQGSVSLNRYEKLLVDKDKRIH